MKSEATVTLPLNEYKQMEAEISKLKKDIGLLKDKSTVVEIDRIYKNHRRLINRDDYIQELHDKLKFAAEANNKLVRENQQLRIDLQKLSNIYQHRFIKWLKLK